MAILFMDSFDHYAIGDHEEKWGTDYNAIGTAVAAVGAYGRRSTNGARFNGASRAWAKVVAPGSGTAIVGFSFIGSGVTTFALAATGTQLAPTQKIHTVGACNWLVLIRGGTMPHIGILMNSSGVLSVARGGPNTDNYTVIGSTPYGLQFEQSYYIEVRVKQGGAGPGGGQVEIRVNEDVWLLLDEVQTYNTTVQPWPYNPIWGWDEVIIGQNRFGGVTTPTGDHLWDYDDLYIADSVTSNPLNDIGSFVGDVRIDYLPPILDGVLQDWTPTGGGTHYTQVDELAPDDDTTTISTENPTDTDTFDFPPALVSGENILAFSVIYSSKKIISGTASIAPIVRSAGSNYEGVSRGNTSTYSYWWGIWTKDPADNGVISYADFNAFEFGVRKKS